MSFTVSETQSPSWEEGEYQSPEGGDDAPHPEAAGSGGGASAQIEPEPIEELVARIASPPN